ncbi:hypothetical protein [Microbacterium sp. YJN-G]|uniref:hypothetical protein n=1 Tax=Microbacterium sp. YJN-G TaxID=2763257 RepID=UPI0018787EAB|nr:hypothetical protein [Microbacterium sp. YJN-G]
MEWDHLFEDLEGQLAAEWEAERAALDAEAERLRISKLTLHERLRVLGTGARLRLEFGCGERWNSELRAVGADWIGVVAQDDTRLRIVPVEAIAAIGADHGTLLAGLGTGTASAGLRERMTLGFVLRDLARRRAAVTVAARGVEPRHGTIDRAGADHLDLAVHDPDEPRRARSVRGFHLIPFGAILWVRVERGSSSAL